MPARLSTIVILSAAAICIECSRAGESQNLKVTVVAGEGAFNNIRQKLARNPAVLVESPEGKPVPDASVTFRAPLDGPGGTFDKRSVFTTTTDGEGRAMALGFRPNTIEGRFFIQVRVTAPGGREGTAEIAQTNTRAGGIGAEKGPRGASRYVLMAIGGGASVGLSLLLSHRGSGSGSSTPAPVPTPVSVGSISVGGPR